MVEIVSVQARPKAIPTAPVLPRLKVIGNQTPTHRITFPAANGSAGEANQ